MQKGIFKLSLQSEPSDIPGYSHIKAIMKNDIRIPEEGKGSWGSSNIVLVIPKEVLPEPLSSTNYKNGSFIVNPSTQIKNFRSEGFDLQVRDVNLSSASDGVGIMTSDSFKEVGLTDDGYAYIQLMGKEPAASNISYEPNVHVLFEMDIPVAWGDKMTIAPFEIKSGLLMELGIGWGCLANFMPTADFNDSYNALEA